MNRRRQALVVLLLAGCAGATPADVRELEAASATTGADDAVARETVEGQPEAAIERPAPVAHAQVVGFDSSELPSQGPEDAAVVVDVFSDFECPYCSVARRHTARLLADFPFVRVRYRHFPLPGHMHAASAAEASVEAYAQGGNDAFWCFHEQVFDHQSALSDVRMLEFASRCNLDAGAMREALRDHRHAERVRQDRAAGEALGVQGTPTFAVNGTVINGDYTDVEEAVEQAHHGAAEK